MRSSWCWVFLLVGLPLVRAAYNASSSSLMREEAREDKSKTVQGETADVKTTQTAAEAPDVRKEPRVMTISQNGDMKLASHDSSSKTTVDSSGMKTTENTNDKERPSILEMEDTETDAVLDELEAITLANALSKKRSPPPVNCQWSPYSPSGSCSRSCGGGTQPQTRFKTTPQAYGGSCSGGEQGPSVPCNGQSCPTPAPYDGPYETIIVTTTTAGANRMYDLSFFAYLAAMVVVIGARP